MAGEITQWIQFSAVEVIGSAVYIPYLGLKVWWLGFAIASQFGLIRSASPLF